MANTPKFITGLNSDILALTPTSDYWYELGFYFPIDRSYFYQIINNELVKKGHEGEVSGVGVTLNSLFLAGTKSLIEINDTLEIPLLYEYNARQLTVNGTVNCYGTINIF